MNPLRVWVDMAIDNSSDIWYSVVDFRGDAYMARHLMRGVSILAGR